MNRENSEKKKYGKSKEKKTKKTVTEKKISQRKRHHYTLREWKENQR